MCLGLEQEAPLIDCNQPRNAKHAGQEERAPVELDHRQDAQSKERFPILKFHFKLGNSLA